MTFREPISICSLKFFSQGAVKFLLNVRNLQRWWVRNKSCQFDLCFSKQRDSVSETITLQLGSDAVIIVNIWWHHIPEITGSKAYNIRTQQKSDGFTSQTLEIPEPAPSLSRHGAKFGELLFFSCNQNNQGSSGAYVTASARVLPWR